MPWDGSGSFSRTNGTQTGATTWANARDAANNITASQHDTHDQDLADGIGACLTKNNESKPTAAFRPNADATYDLGSSALQWRDLYLSRNATIVGTLNAPITQNSQSAAYTLVLTDAGKHILHPTADNNARTFTINSNANVAYPVGTVITFVNQINTLTIAITSDTMTLAGTSTTGSRTLAVNGMATALKVSTTGWIISGTGLS